MRRILGLLGLCILAGAALLPTGASGPDETGHLYLLPPEADTWSLSTFAPEGEEAVLVEPNDVVVPRFMWTWELAQAPTEWRLDPGDVIEMTVHLEGLERVLPVTEVRTDPDAVGKIKVQADLFVGSLPTGDTGIFYVLDPSSESNATGRTFVDPRPLAGGVEEVVVRLSVVEPVVVPARWSVGVRVSVTGAAAADDRPHIALGSVDAPSRIFVSSFPWEELRAIETEERERRACLERVLLKLTCEEPEPVTEPEVAESPGLVAPVGLLLGLGAFQHARRRTKLPAVDQGKGPSPVPGSGP